MPSGKQIDWSQYDQIIKAELPKTTIRTLAKKLELHRYSLGCRAKKLGIKPAKPVISDSQRAAHADHERIQFTTEQITYVRTLAGRLSRSRLAKDLGIDRETLNRLFTNLGIPLDNARNRRFIGEKPVPPPKAAIKPPSCFNINWNTYDPIIREFLPTRTIAQFVREITPELSCVTIGKRARHLSVTPIPYKPTKETKKKISDATGRPWTAEEDQFILNNASTASAKQLGIILNTNQDVVRGRLHTLGYRYDPNEVTEKWRRLAFTEEIKEKRRITYLTPGGGRDRNRKFWKSEAGRIVLNGIANNQRTPAARAATSIRSVRAILEGRNKPHTNYQCGWHNSHKAGQVWYRSSYEQRYYQILDDNESVLTYKVEPLHIQYELDGATRNYVPDVLIYYRDGSRKLVEIKPRNLLNLAQNIAKFNAARPYCETNRLQFQIVTQDELFRPFES